MCRLFRGVQRGRLRLPRVGQGRGSGVAGFVSILFILSSLGFVAAPAQGEGPRTSALLSALARVFEIESRAVERSGVTVPNLVGNGVERIVPFSGLKRYDDVTGSLTDGPPTLDEDADFFAPDYFPVAPGNSWTYVLDNATLLTSNVLFKSRSVSGVKTRVFRSTPGGDRTYYTLDSQGLRLHRLFARKVRLPGLGIRNLLATASPPIVLMPYAVRIGETVASNGIVKVTVPGLGSARTSYRASYTALPFETITVPAGTFEVAIVDGFIAIPGQTTLFETLYLAESVGIVKEEADAFEESVVAELTDTNVNVHDFAVTGIKAPRRVSLTERVPSTLVRVAVQIQNRSPHLEIIETGGIFENLVDLSVESLGACPAPTVALVSGQPQKALPISLKPKKKLAVLFDVTLDCANDPDKSSPDNPGHEDYRLIATVDHAVIDGWPDIHGVDDICPRSVIPPFEYDPYPDGAIKDRGCGRRKSDKTFGDDVTIDVIEK